MTTFIKRLQSGVDIPIISNKRVSVVAVQLALLITGSLYSITSVQAGFNIPTATVAPVTGLFTPVPSPLCSVAINLGKATMNADGTPNSNCPSANQATPFTAKLLMFEEFGTKAMPATPSTASFPAPPDCQSGPNGPELDAFLSQDLNSLPTRVANDVSTPLF